MASRHPIFRFLFFPGLDHKWSRDADIWFLTLQENYGYRFFLGCQIFEGSDKFSQSYDHYKFLSKLVSGHALTCVRDHLQAQKISMTPQVCWHRTSDSWTRHYLFIRLEMFSSRENGANFPLTPILDYLYR